MPTDARTISQMKKFDLGVIYQELKSAPEELEPLIGQPMELLTVNENEAIYVVPNGFMVVEYTLDEQNITFNNFRFAERIDTDAAKRETIAEFVDAIVGDDNLRADQLWDEIKEDLVPAVIASARVRADVEPLRKRIEERLAEHGNVQLESTSDNPLFLRSNYRSLDNFESLRDSVVETIDQSLTGEELNEQEFGVQWTSKGTGKLRRHQISRQKSRQFKKVAKKHRGKLLANLRKARQSLSKMAKRSSFRKRVVKAKRLNASMEYDQLRDKIFEIVENQTNPSLAYLTKPEMEGIITQALAFEGFKDLKEVDQEFVENMAHALVETAREIRPISKRHIVDAATLVISNHEELGTDDMDEAVEIIAQRLYESIDENDSRIQKAAEKVNATLESLIEEVSEELDDHDNSREAKEVRKALESLGEFKSTLETYIEHPENASLSRIFNIVEGIDTLFPSDEIFEEDTDDDTDDLTTESNHDDLDEEFEFTGTFYSEGDDMEEGCKGKKAPKEEDDSEEDDSEEDDSEEDDVEEACKGKKASKKEADPESEEDMEEGCKGKKAPKEEDDSEEEDVEEACKGKKASKKAAENEEDDAEEMEEGCKGKKKVNLPPWLKAKVDGEEEKKDESSDLDEGKKKDDESDDEDDDGGGKKKSKKKMDDEEEDEDEGEGEEDIPDEEDGVDMETVTFTSEYVIEEENIAIPEGAKGKLNSDGSITIEGEELTLVDVPEEFYEVDSPLA